jgi:hypothetical protein
MKESKEFIPLRSGYRKLKSFKVAQMAYDVTVWVCNRHTNLCGRITLEAR